MKRINNINKKRLLLSKKYRQEKLRDETFYEKWFRDYLIDFRYIAQKVIFVDQFNFFIVDFYLPKFNLVIEIDGKQHTKNKRYDSYRTSRLKSIGIRKVLRFKNTDLKTMSPQKIKNILLVNLLA